MTSLLLIACIGISLFLLCRRCKSKAYRQNTEIIKQVYPLTPEKTIMLFDLHGVIFKHDFKNMILTFLRSNQKWRIAVAMLNPCLLWDIIIFLYRRPVPESFFMHMAHNYKHIRIVLPLLIRIANCQKVNPSVVTLLHDLKQKGYTLALLSNIGQQIFNDLLPRHKEIFHLFDHIMVASPETNYVSKPNPKIYELFLKEVQPNGKTIVMIDDKAKNLYAARPFGIIGVLYTTTPELKDELTALGIHW